MKLCPKCSAVCEDDDVICSNCGYLFSPVGFESQQPSEPARPGRPAGSPAKTDGFAVASLVLGIVGVVGICCYGLGAVVAVIALVFGILSLVRARKRGTGVNGLAVAGVVLGAVGVVLGVTFITYLVLHRAEIGEAVREYMQYLKENGYVASSR